jgi:hypothetical protein
VSFRKTLPISELANGHAPLAPDGAAALGSSGEVLAVEVTEQRILIIDARDKLSRLVFTAGVSPLCALAVHAGAGLVAAGAPDGRIALHETDTGQVRIELVMEAQTLTALAFSADGRLLAAGDDGGHVVVYQVDCGQDVRSIEAGKGIRALALYSSESPVLIGDAEGLVTLHRRALPPVELAKSHCAVTSLAFPSLNAGPSLAPGDPLIGRADGTIAKIDRRYRRTVPYSSAGHGPVRALWAGSRDCVMAISGSVKPELCSWTRDSDPAAVVPHPPGVLSRLTGQLAAWLRELYALGSAFEELREQMRDDIAADRAEMLDRLEVLDDATRNRIRPAVVASAVSIYNSYSFDLAVRRIFKANPLPAWTLGLAGTFLFFLLLQTPPVAALGHLRGNGAWLTVLAIVAAAAWIMCALARLGAVGRTVRALIAGAGAVVMLVGTHISFTEPRGMQHLAARWFPVAAHFRLRLTIPYPVWLGAAYVVLLVAVTAAARVMLKDLRTPSTLTVRRRVLGDSLLQALLDVAYRAQVMAEDSELAASQTARASLHQYMRLAARVAAREWVAALRTGSSQADRIIRGQGRAIAVAISRWERQVVLAGAQLPALSNAFAIAVVNAADSDWQALAGDSAPPPARRARMLARQGLSLAVPLGAAVGIMLGVRPLPNALVPLLTFLVGLAVARVLRWLDFSSDIDPGLTISELLRKPK